MFDLHAPAAGPMCHLTGHRAPSFYVKVGPTAAGCIIECPVHTWDGAGPTRVDRARVDRARFPRLKPKHDELLSQLAFNGFDSRSGAG